MLPYHSLSHSHQKAAAFSFNLCPLCVVIVLSFRVQARLIRKNLENQISLNILSNAGSSKSLHIVAYTKESKVEHLWIRVVPDNFDSSLELSFTKASGTEPPLTQQLLFGLQRDLNS